VENAFIEAFNGRLRDECLNVHQFESIADARIIIEGWRVDYNQHRPHSSLGHLTPDEFVAQRQSWAALVKNRLGRGPTSVSLRSVGWNCTYSTPYATIKR